MGNDISTKMASGPPPPMTVQPAAAVSQPVEPERQETKVAKNREQEPERQQASLDEVVSGLNDMVQNLHRHLQFSVEETTGETIIKVVDSETKEVVRQIPSEEIVRLRRRMREAAGFLFQGAV